MRHFVSHFLFRHLLFRGLLLTFMVAVAARGDGDQQKAPIMLIGAHLEGRLDDDPQSGYNRLIRRIMPIDQSLAVYQRYPLVRALRKFEQTQRSCLFPASISASVALTSLKPDELFESAMVDFVSSHILTRKGQPMINSKEDVFGRTIAVQRGVEYTALMADSDRFAVIRTPDDKTALRMLEAGRVDGMYGWFPDAFIIAENTGIQLPDFNPDYILFETTTHVVCKAGTGAEPFVDHVNMRIRALRESGELQRVLGPFARLENK
jgi:hypothetical protein